MDLSNLAGRLKFQLDPNVRKGSRVTIGDEMYKVTALRSNGKLTLRNMKTKEVLHVDTIPAVKQQNFNPEELRLL